MRALWLGAAVAVAIIALLECRRYTLTVFVPYSPHTSNSTRYHIAGAMTSVWRAVLATPCIVPALSAIPTVCTGPVDLDVHRELPCVGLIELLVSQRTFARSIALYTHPPDKLLSAVQGLVDLNLFPAHQQKFGGLRRRWIEGMMELVTHLEVTVARVVSTDFAVGRGVSGMKVLFGFFSPEVTLRTAMGIASEAIADSMSYLHVAITEAHTLTVELRENLQQDVFIARNTDDDIARAVFAAILDLLDVEESLEYLRDDASGAVDDLLRRTPRTFAALTCPVHDVDKWLGIHCSALQGLGEYLDRLRVYMSLFLDRQGTTVDKDAATSPATVETVP